MTRQTYLEFIAHTTYLAWVADEDAKGRKNEEATKSWIELPAPTKRMFRQAAMRIVGDWAKEEARAAREAKSPKQSNN